ncbi:MAG: hypothetical protein K2H90_00020 [Oscillospiraceae bacterium]|nr:hypothetical protein [Oscillospiraceae bacterium]
MYLSLNKKKELLNLERYDNIAITSADENGLCQLIAARFENCRLSDMKTLTSPCSIDHAQKQLSNILRGISHGANLCRVYDEDETAPQDNDDND